MAEFNRTHNDEPVNLCGLGRGVLRQMIFNQLKDSEPPKALAIHGTWGTGKTSLLMQLYEDFGGDFFYQRKGEERPKPKPGDKKPIDSIKSVWFEAWQYQHEPNILAALLKEIRDQLAVRHKVWSKVKENAIPAVTSLLQSIDFTLKAFGGEFGLKGWGNKFSENKAAYQEQHLSAPLESLTHKRLLEDAVGKLIKIHEHVKHLNKGGETVNASKSDSKVIIFIDDLDRCEPETAFKILETIKVYLNLKNCVFVLGMDMEAVEQIIARYYEKVLGGAKGKEEQDQVKLKNLARLYLEKICQDVYHLPMPDHNARQAYFEQLIEDRLGKTEAGETINARILGQVEKYKFLPPYPRSIKILANVLIYYCSKEGIPQFANKGNRQTQWLLIFTYLYAFHYEVYQLCYLYSDKFFYNGTFLPFCEDPVGFEEKRGEHPLMKGLILPEKLTAKEAFAGSSEKELRDAQIARTFPHESLRQVLWIRGMVIDAKDIPDPDLETLKL